MHPVNTFPLHFPKIHSNIIFSSTSMSSNGLLPSCFPTKILYELLFSHACYIPTKTISRVIISLKDIDEAYVISRCDRLW
jgi:hypothetical protein